jgi:hypothetical protein
LTIDCHLKRFAHAHIVKWFDALVHVVIVNADSGAAANLVFPFLTFKKVGKL